MTAQNYPGGWLPAPVSGEMEKSLQDVCEKRRSSFLEAWKNDEFVPMTYTEAAKSPKQIVAYHHPQGGRTHQGAVIQLRGYSMSNVVVVAFNHPDDYFSYSVWVKQEYAGYKEAFARFLLDYHGCSEDVSVADIGYDVDHMRNKKRTPPGTFIRVEAVPYFSNRRWGVTFESQASKDLHKPFHPRGTADWMTVAKLAGVRPPNDWQDAAGIQRILEFKAYFGIDDDDDNLAAHLITDIFMMTYLPRKKGRNLLDQARGDLARNPLSKHIVAWED